MGSSQDDSNLWAGAVKAVSNRQYQAALRKLCDWLDEPSQKKLRAEGVWDRIGLRYMAMLRAKGMHASAGQKVTAALRHVLPEVHLSRSFRLLKAWALSCPVRHHPCMSNRANLVLVRAAMKRGWIPTAAWLRISFVCMLRIGAAARILWPSVIMAGDVRLIDMQCQTGIVISRDKRHAAARVVDVPDKLAVDFLRWLLATRPTTAPWDLRLFRASATTLRKRMAELCEDLEWGYLGWVPHSLRYGGAVHDYCVRGLSVAEVQLRGRWHALSSTESYLLNGMAALASQSFSTRSQRRLRRIVREIPRLSRQLRRLSRQEDRRRGRKTSTPR